MAMYGTGDNGSKYHMATCFDRNEYTSSTNKNSQVSKISLSMFIEYNHVHRCLTDLKIDKTFTTYHRKSHGRQKIELRKKMSHFFSPLLCLSFFIYNKRDFLCHLKEVIYFHIVFYGHTYLKNIISAKISIAETDICFN